MRAIKNKDTKIEVLLGKALWRRGYRYRKNNKTVFGKPDFSFKKWKVAIFCDSEFFHGKDWEKQKHNIKTNQEFWHSKIEANIERDNKVNKKLEDDGWVVLRFWGDDIKGNLEECVNIIEKVIETQKSPLNYTSLRETLNLNESNFYGKDGLAYLTHYIQNRDNGVKKYYSEKAFEYLKENELAAEPVFQYRLPVNYDIPFPPPDKPKFKFIDLFAGIGGFRLAFQDLGGKCVFTSEWDKFCKKTYERNFGDWPFGNIKDIDEKEIPEHDVLLAGFPCQPFSIAGVSKKQSLGKSHGFKDETQGTLFFDIVRILDQKKPKAFVLENVKNLVSHDKGNTFKIIRGALEELGYNIFYKVLDGKHFVPQHRERIFIVGFNKAEFNDSLNFNFPQLPDANHKLISILDKTVEKKYTLSDKLWKYLQDYAAKHKAKGNGFGYGLADFEGITRTLSARYYKDGSEILIPQKSSNPRRLTPRECARLQGYPEEFLIPVSDTQAYRQFGNSVVVPLIKEIGKDVVKTLKQQLVNN